MRRLIPFGLIAIALIAPLRPAHAADRTRDEEVVVSGTVTDAHGSPVAGAAVELRGRHLSFSLRDFKIKRRGFRTVRSETDSSGTFEIRWIWHPYYDRFELIAGAPVGPPGEFQEILELAKEDISRLMKQGDPVVKILQIEDTRPIDELREFLEYADTQDEQQVYQEMGKPDKVRHTTLPTHDETSWWYFGQGKVFRFRNGEKDSVQQFEPIPQNAG